MPRCHKVSRDGVLPSVQPIVGTLHGALIGSLMLGEWEIYGCLGVGVGWISALGGGGQRAYFGSPCQGREGRLLLLLNARPHSSFGAIRLLRGLVVF